MTHAPGPAPRVTAAEISRNFGQWQDRAMTGPIVVTHHGRPRVVIVSAEHYASLSQGGVQQAEGHGAPDSQTSLSAVLNHVSDGFISLDENLRIAAANKVASSYFNLGVERMVGVSFASILPDNVQSVFLEACRRVLRSGQTLSFEVGPLDGADRHIEVQAFPYPGGVAISFSNCTEMWSLREYLADLNSIRAALAAQPSVSFVTLNVRGYMSGCNASFAAMSGHPAQEVEGRRMSDFVHPRERNRVMAAFEAAIDRREVIQLDTVLQAADGSERPVSITMAPMIRKVEPEGVCAILAPLAELRRSTPGQVSNSPEQVSA